LTDTLHDTTRELLVQSLLAWGLRGTVRGEGDAMIVSCNGAEIRIESAQPGLPFRWMVSLNGRRRGAISLVAVLRQVRSALDPAYAVNRVRIAALPAAQ
jgi:hypothetical protein